MVDEGGAATRFWQERGGLGDGCPENPERGREVSGRQGPAGRSGPSGSCQGVVPIVGRCLCGSQPCSLAASERSTCGINANGGYGYPGYTPGCGRFDCDTPKTHRHPGNSDRGHCGGQTEAPGGDVQVKETNDGCSWNYGQHSE